jgi:hypothetical protein
MEKKHYFIGNNMERHRKNTMEKIMGKGYGYKVSGMILLQAYPLYLEITMRGHLRNSPPEQLML